MVSVLVLTYNEQANISRCLESLRWSDDVVVFDSFSTDRTVELAAVGGARVLQRRFDNYGGQREAARRLGSYRYPWVLAIDADEQPDAELVTEMLDIARNGTRGPKAYRMRRKDHFRGRWIKHSTLYPSWFVRFYQHQAINYPPRSVHEYPVVPGETGRLNGHLLHDSFSKGREAWWDKHLKYAELEAKENIKSTHAQIVPWLGVFSTDPVKRRRALKSTSTRLPFRPLLRFLYMYAFRRGFLDGKAGYEYCRLLSQYEYMIVLKMKEIRRREQGLSL